MTLEAKGKITKHNKNNMRIVIPKEIVKDSMYPFKNQDKIILMIKDSKLIIQKEGARVK